MRTLYTLIFCVVASLGCSPGEIGEVGYGVWTKPPRNPFATYDEHGSMVPAPECALEGTVDPTTNAKHEHDRKANTWQRAIYWQWNLDEDRDGSVNMYEIDSYSFNPRTDMLERNNGVEFPAELVYVSFDPFAEGPNMLKRRRNSLEGQLHFRVRIPSGDILTKGWLGKARTNPEQQASTLSFQLPQRLRQIEIEPMGGKTNEWSGSISHEGKAMVTQKLYARTMLKDLPVDQREDQSVAKGTGKIRPALMSKRRITGIGSGAADVQTIKFEHSKSQVVKYTIEEEVGGGINLGGPNLLTLNAHGNLRWRMEAPVKITDGNHIEDPYPSSLDIGQDSPESATSPAEVKYKNEPISLFISVTDMVGAWELSIETKHVSLEVTASADNESNMYSPPPSAGTTSETPKTTSGYVPGKRLAPRNPSAQELPQLENGRIRR